MKRPVFLLTLLVTYAYIHHVNADEEEHEHDHQVNVCLSNSQLTVTFHAGDGETFDSVEFEITTDQGSLSTSQAQEVSHGTHSDWRYTFAVSYLNNLDEIEVEVTGVRDEEEHEEFHDTVEIPDTDDC